MSVLLSVSGRILCEITLKIRPGCLLRFNPYFHPRRVARHKLDRPCRFAGKIFFRYNLAGSNQAKKMLTKKAVVVKKH